MPPALIRKALAAILFIAATSLYAYADGVLQPIPALTRAVIDQTGTLSPADTSALETQLRALEQTQGTQVVVLLVATTAPEDIAAYANRVGNAWKIGRKDVGDGVLVLVAKNDRKMRIEVAKALEGAIPDIAAARIIDDRMKPRFRDGDFAGGLQAAVAALGARIAGEELPEPDPGNAVQDTPGSSGALEWTDFAIFLFFGVIAIGPLVRSLFGAPLGGLLMGSGTGYLAFAITSSLLLSVGAGLLALLYTSLAGGRSGSVVSGGSASGGWSSGSSDSWSSSSSSSDYSSGGGGDFGGGGASGDW